MVVDCTIIWCTHRLYVNSAWGVSIQVCDIAFYRTTSAASSVFWISIAFGFFCISFHIRLYKHKPRAKNSISPLEKNKGARLPAQLSIQHHPTFIIDTFI